MAAASPRCCERVAAEHADLLAPRVGPRDIVPVVASDVGGIQDQIEDGQTGYLVEATDLSAFADRVNRLLADPHDAERMGEAAQACVRDLFLGPRRLGQYVGLLESVLAR
jgi:trehalose synthase